MSPGAKHGQADIDRLSFFFFFYAQVYSGLAHCLFLMPRQSGLTGYTNISGICLQTLTRKRVCSAYPENKSRFLTATRQQQEH